MIIFDISNVNIYLEPPAELLPQYRNTIVFYGVNQEDIPENFYQDASKELKFDWQLQSYLKMNHPAVQPIERLDDLTFQEAIAAQARTRNMWDCCYSTFDTKIASKARVSLLVEYELSPHATIDEEDQRFLFFECRKRYFKALAEFKSMHAGSSEMGARSRAWSQATGEMLEIFGIPTHRMEAIARERSQSAESPTPPDSPPTSSLHSYPHVPCYYFVLPKPKKQKIFYEVR